ncbi:MAG: amino acid permease [Cytophagales bacterium]|nr:amino acid permease [Cytophagales bacterium]
MANGTTTATPQKALTLLDSSMLIMGSMIGSGIFIVSAGMARDLQSPGLLLLAWLVTGLITVFGALSYGELAAAMPQAGGQYVYLKEAYNPMVAFSYGWTLFAVIQTGTIAAVGVAFAKFTGVFVESISAQNLLLQIGSFSISTQQLLAIGCIVALSLLNFRSVKTGALVQNLLTFTKIGALAVMIGLGLFAMLTRTEPLPVTAPAGDSSLSDLAPAVFLGVFFSAMVGSLFSSDAWNNITFTAGEVQNPQRNLPLSLIIGTGSVTLIYLLANLVYVYNLPLESIQTAPEDRVATLLMQSIMGPSGSYFMAAMVMVSTFGCLNGIILAGARVYYAMAKDNLFFKPAARLNGNGVPANALLFQCVWACLLALSGSYGDLLDYVMFAVILFYILTIAGIFILRRTRPGMPRPYKALGYPVIPALYILLATGFCVSLLVYRGQFAFWGLVIVLLGVPLYYLARKGFAEKSGKFV